MSKIKDDLEHLHAELNDALKLVSEFSGVTVDRDTTLDHNLHIKETQSLLERCSEVVNEEEKKPKLRLIHHFACSGGTLFSKCIAALPNTYLLSEAHPTTKLNMPGEKAIYAPTDIIKLSRYARVPDVDELSRKLFRRDVTILHHHLQSIGAELVLREHTHADFCVGTDVSAHSSVMNLLENDFDILNLVTVRHPIDAFLSLKNNDWLHFEPATFDEYCRRLLVFLSQFSHDQIIKYEDFVADSDSVMANIASLLQLEYSHSYKDTFSIFSVTGDSGRRGEVISKRERRPVNDALQQEISESNHFKRVCKLLGYGR